MTCKHPLGFQYDPRVDGLACPDCRAECPGPCVCGAPFLSAQCMNHRHIDGPELDVSAVTK